MPNLEEIIAQARRTLVCPICGRKYSDSEIKLRGNLDNAYIIQTVCDNGHPPLATIFVATAKDGVEPTFIIKSKPQTKRKAITTNEAIDAISQIDKFDGDFVKLWQK